MILTEKAVVNPKDLLKYIVKDSGQQFFNFNLPV